MRYILLAVIVSCRASSSTSNQEEGLGRLLSIGGKKGQGTSEMEDNDTSISEVGNNGREMLRKIVKDNDIEFSVESDSIPPKASRGHRRSQKDLEDSNRRSRRAHDTGKMQGGKSIASDAQQKRRERRSKDPESSNDESADVESRRSRLASVSREKDNRRSDGRHEPEENPRHSQRSYSVRASKHGKSDRRYEDDEIETEKNAWDSVDSEGTRDRRPKKPGGRKRGLRKDAKRGSSSIKDSEVTTSNFVESIKKMKKASQRRFG